MAARAWRARGCRFAGQAASGNTELYHAALAITHAARAIGSGQSKLQLHLLSPHKLSSLHSC